VPVRSIVTFVSVTAALAVVPAPAGAAEVAVDRTCYSPGELITEVGTGFTPGAEIVESLAGMAVDPGGSVVLFPPLYAPPATADPAGGFTRLVQAPDMRRAEDRRELMVASFAEQAAPDTPAATATWTLARWGATIEAWRNRRADPTKTMVVDTYGWTSVRGTLHVHYYRAGKHIGSTRVGRLKGACGDLRKRVRQFPSRNVTPGRYTVYLSASRTLDKGADAWLRSSVVVPRR
jgi:hypothetical protein